MSERKLVSFDWAIKRLLRSKTNFEILEGFLSELLNEDVKIVTVLESESNKDTKVQKQNRLDLKVKNSKDELVIIEIQFESEHDFLQHVLFATSKAITENLEAGHPYSDVVKIYSVNILYFDFGHGDDYIYYGNTTFRGIHKHDELELNERQKELFKKDFPQQIFPEYYLLKVNNFDDVARNTLDEWIYFLKNEEIKGFLKWFEREIGTEIDSLANKTAIKEYHEHDFNQLLEVLKKDRNKVSINPSYRKIQELLENQFTKSMSILDPLKARIKDTDKLIDEIVYRLYGLTEEEIKIVDGKT